MILHESTYYYGHGDLKLFPWLPVPSEKYGALSGAISGAICVPLRLKSAFQHYTLVLLQT